MKAAFFVKAAFYVFAVLKKRFPAKIMLWIKQCCSIE